jgi:hypothetical protein
MPASKSKTPLIEHLDKHVARLVGATIGPALILDLIPALKYIPGWMAKWKRESIAWHEQETRIFEGLVTDVANKMVSTSLFSSLNDHNHYIDCRLQGRPWTVLLLSLSRKKAVTVFRAKRWLG